MTRALTAERVWTGAGFSDGVAIVLEGDRIADVRPRADVEAEASSGELEDWGRVALLPGTVNAHGHAFQNLFKGVADDRSFDSWRDDVLYPLSERLSARDIYFGSLFAFAEALYAGVTTTVDFFYLHDESNDNAEQVIAAARDAGVRLVLARAFYDEDAPTAAPRRYRERSDDAARRTKELAARYDDDPMVSVQPAPHSLHAASPDTIATALAVARDLGVPYHLHLAEAEYEVELVRERYGTTPVRLLHREGLLDPALVAVHAVWVDDEELDMLADADCAVVHCPGANAYLGDGMARLPEMLQRGLRVALGPDGGCANNRQSVFDEMRTAGLIAKARLRDGGAIDAATTLTLGTAGGGSVLRIPVGSFETGRFADIVALDLDDLSLHPLDHLERNIVNSMQATAITRVMVGGRVVLDGGVPGRFDGAELGREIAVITRRWARSGQK